MVLGKLNSSLEAEEEEWCDLFQFLQSYILDRVMQSCRWFISKTSTHSPKSNIFQRVFKSVINQITRLWVYCSSVLWKPVVFFSSALRKILQVGQARGPFLLQTSIFTHQTPSESRQEAHFNPKVRQGMWDTKPYGIFFLFFAVLFHDFTSWEFVFHLPDL